MNKVLETLKDMNINYEIITHPAVYTTCQANKYIKNKEKIFLKIYFYLIKKTKTFI